MNDLQPHRARKRFGQNFLHDQGIIRRIAAAVRARPGQQVLEIGPGQGALTAALLASGCQLLAIELDRDLVPLLERKFGDRPNFRLQQGDALTLDLASCGPGPWRVVGNLPYNISTPLMFHLLSQRDAVTDMHFMLQKEVVERLAAQPGSKAYGRLGIMAQYYCDVEALFDVPPGAFTPRPKVDSAVVRLTPHAVLPHPVRSEKLLHDVVRTAFNQRRKTLRNALQGMIDSAALEQLGIDPGSRAETLPLATFVTIADQLADQQDA
ncbi:MAG: 16S rRNA (adenine(1518)-N(6)/adenine(1519)-N(6))-dimethyltransferase RsmA [Spongiibacteraceae bacterium]|nr:16S rRNA (adenine(1518)-N(6)/adenine(1519)-N(6))-dimethyltransferase RsmA [Spongiibacteraceae bacterium]